MLGPSAVFNHGGDRARLLEPSPPSIAGRPRHSKFAAQCRHTLLATHRPHHKLHPLFAHVRSLPWHRPEPPRPQTLPNSGVTHVLKQPVTDVMRPNSTAAPHLSKDFHSRFCLFLLSAILYKSYIGAGMATALIHFNDKQKRRLTLRAKLRGKSFSQEVRDAVDLYLDVPVEKEADLANLAREANRSADRMIKKLDDTISYVDRVLKHRKNGK